MEKSWKCNEDKLWKQTYLWWWCDKYTETKIKLYADSIITNFHKENA